MRKIGAQQPPPNLPKSITKNIIYTLFPEHEETQKIIEYENNEIDIFFTEHELKAATRALNNQKPQAQMEYRQKYLKSSRKHICSYCLTCTTC